MSLLPSTAAAETAQRRAGPAEVMSGSPLAGQSIQITSEEREDGVEGRVQAIVQHPFELLAAELRSAAAWCEIVFLHLNVKACLHDEAAGAALRVYAGRRYYQPLEDAEQLDLNVRVVTLDERRLETVLEGEHGPYGMRDFRLRLEVAPHSADDSLVRLHYSLAFGSVAQLALRAYFTFGGRGRVGFTIEGYEADGAPRHVRGLRGMIERNVMRFYLALKVHLDTLTLPEGQRLDERLQRWFAATARYPRQLFELDRETYVEQKRREYARQQALPADR